MSKRFLHDRWLVDASGKTSGRVHTHSAVTYADGASEFSHSFIGAGKAKGVICHDGDSVVEVPSIGNCHGRMC